jgi:hypothetical protein
VDSSTAAVAVPAVRALPSPGEYVASFRSDAVAGPAAAPVEVGRCEGGRHHLTVRHHGGPHHSGGRAHIAFEKRL